MTQHTTYPSLMPNYANLMLATDGTCDKCAHWNCQLGTTMYAKVNGRTVQVAQCLRAALDDAAPYAEVTGPEAAVFTQASSGCPAFDLHADEQQALVDMAGEVA